MTKVININTTTEEKCIYIGHKTDKYEESVFCNPFEKSSPATEEGVYNFLIYMLSSESNPIKEHFDILKNQNLGCHCTGLCHGDVIVYLIDGTTSPGLQKLMDTQKYNNIRGMLYGAFLGDALGVPHEKISVKKSYKYTGVLEHETLIQQMFQPNKKLAAGQYSDDTEMALMLARSIAKYKTYDRKDVVTRYIEWANSGMPMMGINTKDLFKSSKAGTNIKYETYQARFLKKFGVSYNADFEKTSEEAENAQSNGTLMRCMALACLGDANDPNFDIKHTIKDVWITNPSKVNLYCNYYYLTACRAGIYSLDPTDVWNFLYEAKNEAPKPVQDVFNYIQTGVVHPLIIEKKGWVCDGFYFAMLALHRIATRNFTSYEDFIAEVILAGGDTDTNACIAGGLLGSYLGYIQLIENPVTKRNIDIMVASTQPSSKTEIPRSVEYQLGDLDQICKALASL